MCSTHISSQSAARDTHIRASDAAPHPDSAPHAGASLGKLEPHHLSEARNKDFVKPELASASSLSGGAPSSELALYASSASSSSSPPSDAASSGPGARVSLALLLEASAAAAEAEKKAEKRLADPELVKMRAAKRAETDKYITEAIHRVQTMPRNVRTVELKPRDRRTMNLKVTNPGWTRFGEIEKDPTLHGECQRLVRGMQGCGRECDAKFTNLIDFAIHVDEAHDFNFRPFLCPKDRCPWAIIGFHERSECTRHIRTKHYKAMYACEFEGCSKVYNRSDAFRRHVRQAHADPLMQAQQHHHQQFHAAAAVGTSENHIHQQHHS